MFLTVLFMQPLKHSLGVSAFLCGNLELPVSGDGRFAWAWEVCQRMEVHTVDGAQPCVDQSDEAQCQHQNPCPRQSGQRKDLGQSRNHIRSKFGSACGENGHCCKVFLPQGFKHSRCVMLFLRLIYQNMTGLFNFTFNVCWLGHRNTSSISECGACGLRIASLSSALYRSSQ